MRGACVFVIIWRYFYGINERLRDESALYFCKFITHKSMAIFKYWCLFSDRGFLDKQRLAHCLLSKAL